MNSTAGFSIYGADITGGAFNANIVGFRAGNAIDLGTGLADTLSYDQASSTLTISYVGITIGALHISGTYQTSDFVLNTTGPTAILTTTAIACFAQGTTLRTDTGAVRVEDLRQGDTCLTRSGPRQVIWTGHRTLDCATHPRPHDVQPIRIQAGAFGDNTPHRDLTLSPDHAVFIDGVLIPVRYLVNGRTITQCAVNQVTYWHIELDRHDILFAEGLPCESYLDTGNRGAFANGGAAVHLHPDFALRVWETQACAPLVRDGVLLECARSWLRCRAAELGHTRTTQSSLALRVHGETIPAAITGTVHRFAVPASARTIHLTSRSAIPAQTHDSSTEHRTLGVAVARLVLNGADLPLTALDGLPGWHQLEHGENDTAWRWTDGHAELPIPGGGMLEVHTVMTELYWTDTETPVLETAAA